ncbi:MAG TPA: DNA methyltransferase [Jatrophihabitans sp.]|nr:DNA methyltransferase [Jatrophihabitans sp.]
MPGAAAFETGILYCDDNLNRMATLSSGSVDLIYLDPPFFSNRIYEVIWGDEAEVRSFADRWEGGIQVYISWMRDRAMEMRRLLRPGGALYLHCDPHASHYLKVMLDDVFGANCFRSEIVWKRTTAHNSAKRYGPVHDLILYYTSEPSGFTWNPVYQSYDEKYVASKYRHVDVHGRLYRLSDMTGAGIRQGDSGTEWRGYNPTSIGRHWAIPSYAAEKYFQKTGRNLEDLPFLARLDAMDEIGLVQWPRKPGGKPEMRRLLEDMPGVQLQDVWTDIDALNARARERLGYPTQKPESLLERIITASTNKGDVVLDPFCGCGTTVTVAHKMEREWVGIDISPTAVNIMDRRIKRIPGAASPKLIGLPSSVESLRKLKPFEFQNWVIQQFYGVNSKRKTNDMGIDGYTYLTHDPIQVKQSESVGRNVVDNFETAVKRDRSTSGWIVAFSFTRGAHEEVARARWEEKLDIKLVTVEQLLKPRSERRGPLWPEPATVTEIPLLTPRDPQDLPTAEELVANLRVASA